MDSKTSREIIESKLNGYEFFILSNREPYIHVHTHEGIKCKIPAGGLTAALDPIMQACGGTWIAGGSGDADRGHVDEHDRVMVPPSDPKYTLRRVWMSKDEVDKYYFGFANQVLWPLCHCVFQKPIYDLSFWEGYKHSNELFAKATLEEMKGEKVFVWFQDYHLALAPKLIKSKKDILSGHFWHIPWPHWETFMTCPWAEEILEGLLANNLIGFHLKNHCINFLGSVEHILGAEVDYKELTAKYDDHEVRVRPFPISIDFDVVDKLARTDDVKKAMEWIRSPEYIPHEFIAAGVDRVDYTKGIMERFQAIDRFLEKYPEYQNRFVYVEAAALSRTRVPAYMKLNEEIEELVDNINWKYERGYWKPIKYIERTLDYNKLLGLYRAADMFIVSSLQDGMNLVAKEFVAANVNHGVLVLSQFAGAAEELKDAVIVNPYDIESFADAIKMSIEMSDKEKQERMENMRKTVRENNIYNWMENFILESSKLL